MSRLYDKLMIDKEIQADQYWQQFSEGLIVISVDNVTEYIHRLGKQGRWSEVPVLVPPFNASFIETRRPKKWRGSLPEQWGGTVLRSNAENAYGDIAEFLKVTHNEIPPKTFKGIHWAIFGVLCLYDRKIGLMPNIVQYAMGLNEDGSIRYPTLFQPCHPAIDGMIEGIQNRYSTTPENAANIMFREFVSPMLAPIFRGIGLMNCKNVELINVTPPPKLSKRHEKERGLPLVSFKTIKVMPVTLKHYLDELEQNTNPDSESAMPLHIMRGHFKDFRDGKGLFGKYKGVYWWDQHVRGTIDNGAIIKDYTVKPLASGKGGSRES